MNERLRPALRTIRVLADCSHLIPPPGRCTLTRCLSTGLHELKIAPFDEARLTEYLENHAALSFRREYEDLCGKFDWRAGTFKEMVQKVFEAAVKKRREESRSSASVRALAKTMGCAALWQDIDKPGSAANEKDLADEHALDDLKEHVMLLDAVNASGERTVNPKPQTLNRKP